MPGAGGPAQRCRLPLSTTFGGSIFGPGLRLTIISLSERPVTASLRSLAEGR